MNFLYCLDENYNIQSFISILSLLENCNEKINLFIIHKNPKSFSKYISKIENFPTNEWRKVIDINLTSSFITSKYIIPVMKKNNSGRIINISSVHGLVASENKSAYVASKHGLIGLTKAIALELSKTKITCNAISPGWVLTPLVEKQIKKLASKNKTSIEIEKKNLLFEKHPNQKFVSGKEIASLVNFLISKDAQNITGSSYSIDGGWVSV